MSSKQDGRRVSKQKQTPHVPLLDDLTEWAADAESLRHSSFDAYATSIAEARYIMRRVSRIVDEEARKHDLDPLEHQAMLQVYGAEHSPLTVSQLAERLDIAPALASRVVNSLDTSGLIVRLATEQDKRVTKVRISERGAEIVRTIDADVHVHIQYFQLQLSDEQRAAALSIFAFYLGLHDRGRISPTGTSLLQR